ncbi:MAG: hypothetical protein MI861_10900 [Pirellulales bacterium]|nr:hypothetical protein [Pirellulales bacterium]
MKQHGRATGQVTRPFWLAQPRLAIAKTPLGPGVLRSALVCCGVLEACLIRLLGGAASAGNPPRAVGA